MKLKKEILEHISSIARDINEDNDILYIFKDNDVDDTVIHTEKNLDKFKKLYILCLINKLPYCLDLEYNPS